MIGYKFRKDSSEGKDAFVFSKNRKRIKFILIQLKFK